MGREDSPRNTDIAIEHSQVFTIRTRQNGVCSFSFLGKRRFILLGLSFSEIGDYWDHREVLPGLASAKETSRGRAERHRMLSQSPRGPSRLCPVLGCAAFRVLKPLRHMFRYGTTASCKGSADWARRREPCAACTPDSIQTLRKLISATRADASPLCFHGPNRPSAATRASQSAWISSLMSAGSETVRPTSSRNSAV